MGVNTDGSWMLYQLPKQYSKLHPTRFCDFSSHGLFDLAYSTRHEISPAEWASNLMREWSVASMVVMTLWQQWPCHAWCVGVAVCRCLTWALLLMLFLPLAAYLAPLGTIKAIPQGRSFQLSCILFLSSLQPSYVVLLPTGSCLVLLGNQEE